MNIAKAVWSGVLKGAPVLEGMVISCVQLAASQADGVPPACRRGWQQQLSDVQKDRVCQAACSLPQESGTAIMRTLGLNAKSSKAVMETMRL